MVEIDECQVREREKKKDSYIYLLVLKEIFDVVLRSQVLMQSPRSGDEEYELF